MIAGRPEALCTPADLWPSLTVCADETTVRQPICDVAVLLQLKACGTGIREATILQTVQQLEAEVHHAL